VGLPFSQTLFKDRQFWQVVGMLTASDDGISVEWRSDEYNRPWGKAAAQHVARGPIRTLNIPWPSIERVTFRGKFFGPGQLQIVARSLAAIAALPGAAGNTWWVRIAKSERRNAREFALASDGAISGATSALLSDGRR
jgi:hypothetical protein